MRRLKRAAGPRADRGWRKEVCFLALVAVAAAAQAAHGQQGSRLSVDQVIVSEDSQSVTAVVSVVDPFGRPVPGLSSFEASIDGNPVALESVRPVVDEEAGIAVLLLIDVSGSMEGEPLAQAKAAAASFIEGLLAQDVAAVAPFAGGPPPDFPFTSDHAQLLAFVDSLASAGSTGTALYDAVAQGVAAIAEAPTERRAIVLLTDGQDSGSVSRSGLDQALEAAEGSGVPIFAIGLGEGADVGFLQTLADRAGGAFYRAPAPQDVGAIFDALGAMLRGQYALVMPLPRAESANRTLLVSTELEGVVVAGEASFFAPGAVVGGGGGSNVASTVLLLVVLSIVLAAVAAGGVVLRRRRPRAPKSPLPGGPGRETSVSVRRAGSQQAETPLRGRLTVVAGPDTGASVDLSGGPVDIGSDSSCGLRIVPVDGAVAGVHARVWLQGDRLMLHHLARGKETLVGEKAVEWAALEPEDTLRIGPHVIAFSVEP